MPLCLKDDMTVTANFCELKVYFIWK